VDFLRHLCPLGCSLLHHVLPPCPFGEIVPFWTKLGVQFQFELVKWYTTIVMLYRVLLYYIMFYPNSCCLSPGLLPIKPKKNIRAGNLCGFAFLLGRQLLITKLLQLLWASCCPWGPWGPILLAPRQIAECDE
jgi:hypothetical protein